MTLHSILGIPRVKKRSSSAATKRASSSSTPPSWTAALARTKPGTSPAPKPLPNATPINDINENNNKKLPNLGSPASLPSPTPLSTPLQLHTHILATMFSPLPGPGGTGAGLGSARIAVPRVVSVAHLQALLLASGAARSPADAERAVAGAVRRGEGRRVGIPTLLGRGGGSAGVGGELFVRMDEVEGLVAAAAAAAAAGGGGGKHGLLGEEMGGVGERFLAWLRRNPGRGRLREGEWEGLGRREVDVLVRAGFLTAVNNEGGPRSSCGSGGGGGGGLRARPEGRYRMVSLETVARAPAGSVAAAGGEGVLHAAGGTGVRGITGPAGAVAGEYSVAVPGSGVFLKLASAALEHLADLLRKTQYREMSESDLREKWDGGVAGDSEVALAKKTRGEFAGVMPGRTKKWKEFHGLAFDWVLREAVGAGMVEVFETRSVGRGVRLV